MKRFLFLLAACGAPPAPHAPVVPQALDAAVVDAALVPDAVPPPPPPEHYLLRFGTLEVAPYRVSSSGVQSSDHWDGEVLEPAAKSGLCSTLGTLVGGAAGAVVGGLPGAAGGATVGEKMSGVLCPSKQLPVQRERDPRAPDLRVSMAGYTTPVEQDSYLEVLDAPLVVPRAVVGAALNLVVEDREKNGEAEKIAVVSLPLAELDAAAAVGGVVAIKPTGSLAKLEITVATPPPATTTQIRVPTTQGLTLVEGLPILAGQRVSVRATGSYKLSADYPAIGPAGGGPGKKKLPDPVFAAAPAGAAVAVAGEGENIDRVVVGECVSWTAQHSGRLVLGVNDAQRSDNSGDIEFEIEIRNATADEWRSPAAKPCQ